MLERVTLENFQRHHHLVVDLDTVTTVVGPNGAGKTAVLRALRWVAFNRPPGLGFLRTGATHVAATVTAEGRAVGRHRSERENYYAIDGEVYRSLRAPSVPQAVCDLLKLDPVNFQTQLAAPFWLLDTAGEVSRHLNEVVNLEEIDATLAEAASAVKGARAAVVESAGRLAVARATRDDLSWTEGLDRLLSRVEQLEARLTKVDNDLSDLSSAVARVEGLEDRVRRLDRCVAAGEKAIDLGAQVVHLESDLRFLGEAIGEVERATAVQSQAAELVTAWTRVADLRRRGDQVAEDCRTLEQAIVEVETKEDELCRVETGLADAERELREATRGKCPVCGQTFDPLACSPPTSTGRCEPRSPVRRPTRSGGPF